MTFDEWWEEFVAEHDEWKYADSAALRRAAFQAGVASRDTEVVSLTNQRDYEYVRAENAEHDRLLVKIAPEDAEIAELVEALRYLAEAILTKADADYTRRQMDEAVRVMELHGITMPVPYALAKVRKP